MQLIDYHSEKILIPNLELAQTVWQRFRGLMLRKTFPEGFGILLNPCSSVHTMFMVVPIDIYFIDQDGVIVDLRKKVRPWSIVLPKGQARMVLEVPNATEGFSLGTKVVMQRE